MSIIHALQRHARVSRSIFVILLFGVGLAACGGGSGSGSSSPTVPTITGFSPAFGDPGSEVTITGTGFPADTSQVEVGFDSGVITVFPVLSATPTQLVVQVPAGLPDTMDYLSVATASGDIARSTQQFSVLDDLYNVIAAPATTFYAPSKFIAVGQNGTVLTSGNGITWTEAGFSNAGNLNAVTASASTVVMVGDGVIFSSNSFAGMLKRHSPTKQRLFAVTQSSSAFVAVGDNGTIVESPDGITWTKPASPTTQPLISVVWSGTQFVACGENGVILNSPDGVTWNLEPASPAGTDTLTAVAFGNGTYVIAGVTGPMLMSTDGLSWTSVASSGSQATEGMIWTGSQFVAVGDQSIVLTSPDGVNWSAQNLDLTGKPYLGNAAIKGSTYVAVGKSGTVVTSTDGLHWTLRRGG